MEREQRKYLTLNADAETFVPVAQGLPSQCIPEDVQLRSHLPDARPKEINVGLLQQATSFEPKVQQNKIYREPLNIALKKRHSAKDCLYFLEQYTRGQPRELVRSCQHMPHELGYAKAKSLLCERFGDSIQIASAYMDKVLTWTVVRSEDVKALQAYSLLLRACCNAMGGVGSMHELDVTANMQSVIKKLPFKLTAQTCGQVLPAICRKSLIEE